MLYRSHWLPPTITTANHRLELKMQNYGLIGKNNLETGIFWLYVAKTDMATQPPCYIFVIFSESDFELKYKVWRSLRPQQHVPVMKVPVVSCHHLLQFTQNAVSSPVHPDHLVIMGKQCNACTYRRQACW